MKRIAIAAVSLAVLVSNAGAQPLADRVPQDAVAYFGWAGADALGEAYAGSNLRAVLDETRIRDLFGRYLSDAEAKLVKQQPDAREPMRLMRTLGGSLWKYPTAVFVGKPDLSDINRPKFFLAFLCQAGDASAKLSEELNAILANAPKGGPAIKAFSAGGLVGYTVGYETPEQAIADEGSGALANSTAFSASAKQVNARPATFSWLNAESIIATAEQAITAKEPQVQAKVAAFLDSSGLRAVRSYASAGGFDGKEWIDQSFIAVTGERTGLLAAMPSGAADAALLRNVPDDAIFFATTRFDTAKFIRAMRDALGKTDEQALQYFNMGLSGAQQALGTNVLDNLLEPLGPDTVFYVSPRTGSSVLGLVAVNKLDDPDKMRKGLNTASVNLANWINVAIRKAGGGQAGISVHTATTRIGDADVSYFATPLIAPSWTISNGSLFVGLYPQTVGSAVRQAGKGGRSIVDSEKYQALLKRLGNPAAESSSFYDLQTSASFGSMYPQMMALIRYAGVGDLFGLTLPEPLLPPMDVLLDHLSPAGSVSWSDDAGFHSRSVTPFPGAKLVSEQGMFSSMGVGSSALGASILLPALNRARETANRVKSAANLKSIGMASMTYAADHRGRLPADIATLVSGQHVQPEVFSNPRSDNTLEIDPSADLATKAAAAQAGSDYVYLGGGRTLHKSRPINETILAHERPDGLEDGLNIVFMDCHVQFFPMEEALRKIEAAAQEPEQPQSPPQNAP